MLLRIFKGTGPGVIFLIIIILIAVWIGAFLNPQMSAEFNYEKIPMPLYGLVQKLIGNSPLLGVIFSFSMVCLMIFFIVNFNTASFFITERTFLPALIYILFSGFFPQYQLLNPVIPASIFLMIAIRRIMDGYRKQGTAYNFFDAALLISIGSLFYGNLIWFGLLVIIGIAILRTANILEIAISILGLLTPYIITFGLYYVIGKDLTAFTSLIEQNLLGKSIDYQFSRLTIVALITSAIIILVSIVYLLMLMNTKKIKSRKIFTLLVWVFLISVTGYFALPSVSVEIVWITAIPVSYFLTHYFVFYKKKIVSEIFLSLLFVFVLLIQIRYLK
ncbi:MAG: hypothetical protein EPN88_08560 [Bacteroidetes bacterium]|nr:MAG: hypothetical protein EPN88_08560 [Bacteroidota bacterium]